jgi:hypothetical protein
MMSKLAHASPPYRFEFFSNLSLLANTSMLIFIVNALIFVDHESPFVLAVTIWRLIGLCLSLGT